MADADETGVAQASTDRKGREGARWINQRPTSAEFAAWAKENIKIADGLEIEDYVGGIVLIPATDEKSKYVSGFTDQGAPIISTRPELVYVPYPKVETRIQYFWDLLELKDEKWIGVVEPVVTQRPDLSTLIEVITDLPAEDDELPAALQRREIFKPATTAAIVHQLPPGFFLMPVPLGEAYAYSLGCSYRVAIYERGEGAEARPIREGRGTKQVALVTLGWGEVRGQKVPKVDESALMKAETGAIGRALGAAGIFTIPGSGVATAEDMLEAGSPPAAATSEASAGPSAPLEVPAPRGELPAGTETEEDDEQVLGACTAVVSQLQEDFPAAYAAFGEWCSKRRPKITELSGLKGPALRGVRSKLEKLLDDAKKRQVDRGEENASPSTGLEPEPQPHPSDEGERALV